MKVELIYPELSYVINGLLFQVHNKLGRFCREKQYSDEIEQILKENKVRYQRECNMPNNKTNRFDFIIESKIILEIKAKPFILKDDYYQMNRYLELSSLKLGLLVNFRNRYLKPKRIVNSKMY